MPHIISLVFDFDITLSPRFQQCVILDDWGMDENDFWAACGKRAAAGYDLEHSYIKTLVDLGRENRRYRLSNEDLYQYGRQVELYPGLSRKNNQRSLFDDLQALLQGDEFLEHDIRLECYCISGGLVPMIRGAFDAHGLANDFKDVFACSVAENNDGFLDFPKETVGHTVKTQKLFMISKGSLPSLGYTSTAVNHAVEEYRIPFERMIFLGDEQTDIPAFSLVKKMGGISLAVYREEKKEDGSVDENKTVTTYETGYKLAIEAGRAEQILPADYSAGKPLKIALMHHVSRMAKAIVNAKSSAHDV